MAITYDDESRRRRYEEAPKPGAGDDRRDPFEHDRDRLIHSGAFRRLQGKTQVVSPGEADFFRTRMTHTLECAQIGRALADRVGANLSLVEAACMAHDLGHPPFGHTGEVALNGLMANYGGFEGNAQSLRIVSRLETKVVSDDMKPFGLNLTRKVLAGMLKYPWARDNHPASHYEGKFGFYEDDSDVFTFASAGLSPKSRSLEAALMDWADDIAYAVHDLEDGIRAGIISIRRLQMDREERSHVAMRAVELQKGNPLFEPWTAAAQADALEQFLSQEKFFGWATEEFSRQTMQKAGIKQMTSNLIHFFITSLSKDDPLTGEGDGLNVPAETRLKNRLLNAVVFHYVIDQPELATLQYGQRQVVDRLFDAYLNDPRLLPEPNRQFLAIAEDDTGKAREVCDYIAGMTDRYAQRMFDRLFGGGRGSVSDLL